MLFWANKSCTMEQVVFVTRDNVVSVVKDVPKKISGSKAGFIRPSSYVTKKIEADRFCCGNCVRYDKKKKICFSVDMEDIQPLDCCNIFLDEETYENESKQNKQMSLLPNEERRTKYYIEAGFASSEELTGIVNGTSYAIINNSALLMKMSQSSKMEDMEYKPKKGKKSKSKGTNKCIIL